MNEREFSHWLKDYLEQFPDTKGWLESSGLSGQGPLGSSIVQSWRLVLRYVPLIYAARVTDMMAAGDLEPPSESQLDDIGRIVRDQAREMIDADREQKVREKRAQELQQASTPQSRRYKYGMGQIFRAYMGMRDQQDANALLKMRDMCDQAPDQAPYQDHAPAGQQELF